MEFPKLLHLVLGNPQGYNTLCLYDGLSAIHYAYMVKVLEVLELAIFEDAVGHAKWESAMDE